MPQIRPSCGGVDGGRACNFYRPHRLPEIHAAQAIGMALAPGMCWRYPRPVGRRPEDACGEHQAVRGHWIGVLARDVAKEIVAQLDAARRAEPPIAVPEEIAETAARAGAEPGDITWADMAEPSKDDH